jgi:hypothetical protein
VTSQQELRDFLALNPDFDQRRDPETSVREWEVLRSQGRRVFFDLLDENDGHPAQAQVHIARRAEAARQGGEAREARLEERFARLNPEFGVLSSRTSRDQQRFAQGRERALALGTRVHLAEARENTPSRELAAWEVRQRALRAGHRARDQQPVQRPVAERATLAQQRAQARQRTGAER